MTVSPRSVVSVCVGASLSVVAGPLRLRQARLARRQGVRRLLVALSFDCDTERDIEVVASVHQRCLDAGVVPTYAVPGELLRAGRDVYGEIARGGAEFINHGGASHTSYERATRTYVSTLSYDALTLHDVELDVRAGHRAVRDVTGVEPRGFRAPHFGTFQRRGQLKWLHDLLRQIGYRYSSTTMPLLGLVAGPVQDRAGLIELPVTGRPGAPNRVLDTWSFRFAPGRRVDAADYVAEVSSLLRWHVERGVPGVLNLYGDPSQVEDWPEFFMLLADLAPYAVPSMSALVEEAGR